MGSVEWPPPPVAPTPQEEELLRSGDRMNLEAWRSAVRARPGCEFESFDGFFVHSYPLPAESLNEVIVTHRPSDPDKVLKTAVSYFSNRSAQWGLVCPQEWGTLMGAPCREAGLTPLPPRPTMVLAANSYRPVSDVTGFVCRRVGDRESLAVFNQTFARANDLPPTSFWLSSGFLTAPNWDLLVGFLGGEPVATGVGYTFGGITGIWGIATLPSARGRGIGTAITGSVAEAGKRWGSRAAHLWATEMGLPVYRRMGFRHVANKAAWIFKRPT
jgi:GNAT superfamily N-acetyltransferase